MLHSLQAAVRGKFLSVFLISALLISPASASCQDGRPSAPLQSVTIGSTQHEADTLLYIADAQGFFTANGLDVTIRQYSSGSNAVAGMVQEEVDIATASEYVLVQRAFQKQPIQTVGVISKNWSVHLVARTDKGIRQVADLKGKKIGVPGMTLAQFTLVRFLDLNGLHGEPMTLSNIDIAQSVDVLVNGDVDAVETWEPYVSRIRERMSDKVIIWPTQNDQPQYKNMITTAPWMEQHPDIMNSILRALAEAEDFAKGQPDRAKAIIKDRLQYDDTYIASVWTSNEFSLHIDQSLILAMEDEARWMISNNLTAEKSMPDFLGLIHTDALKSVKPGAVSIVGK